MKKFMKKCLPMLALSVVALVGATGCGGTDTPDKPDEPTTTLKDLKATVTWWNNYKDPVADGVAEDEARKKSDYTEYYFAKDAITEFNKIYPNITVETTYKGGYSDIQKAVNTGMNSGDIPSIASGYPDAVAGYVSAGVALDVGQYFDDAELGFGKTIDSTGTVIADANTTKADFNQAYLKGEAAQYSDNKHYSMPYSKSGETMAINQTLFDKVGAGETGVNSFNYKDPTIPVYEAPVAKDTKKAYATPTSWTELMATARQMKIDYPDVFKDNVDSDGLFTAIPVCYDSAENMYISFSKMLGIPYTASGSTVKDQVLFNNADARKMVVQLKKWNNEGLLATQNQLYYSNKAKGYHQYSSTMVTNGKCFVAFSSTAGATYFSDGASFLAKLNETPVIDKSIYETNGTGSTAKSTVISQGPSLAFFKKSNADDQKAAWLFYKHLTNTDNAANLAIAKSYFPLRQSSYSTDKVKTIVDAAGTTTLESSYNDKKVDYTGQVLKLNETYSDADRYMSTAVFDLSSACRTAVGNLVKTVFDDKTAKTDAEIATLVDTAFNDAYKAVVTQ